MTKFILFFSPLIFFFQNLEAKTDEAYSLAELYQEALQYSKLVQVQEARVDQRQRQVQGVWSEVLPEISAQGQYLRQDSSDPSSSSSGTREFRQETQTSAKIFFRQPIFQGLKEIYGIQAAKAARRAEEARLMQSKTDLLAAVANLYFSILAEERSLDLLQEQLKLTSERVHELREWEKIGRSKKSELLSAEAQQAILRSELEGAKEDLLQLRLHLPVLAGLPASARLLESKPSSFVLDSIDTYLARLNSRGDLQARQQELLLAQKQKAASLSEFFPTLEAQGNYYLKRSGAYDGVDWDISLLLQVPIFSGGGSRAARLEAEAIERERQLQLEDQILNARREVESIYRQLETISSQIELLKRAADISEASYREQQQDYKRGLVTNLDVLESLNTFVEAKRRWVRAAYERDRLFAELKLASGELP